MLGPRCGNIFPKNWYSSLASLRTCFSVPDLDLADDAPKDDTKVVEVIIDFLIYVTGNTFLSTSNGYMKLGYLAAFVDLGLVGSYDWGSCAMMRLYNYLSRATRFQTGALYGFWPILN
ncbi:hypothetical protein MKX01_037812, partial [Papaver californicum]